jgi:TIR domain
MIIFLSYAKEDSERVGQIYKELKEAGYQPWMDNQDISPGQEWKFEIQNAISICDAAIIFLSSKSVSKTGYVQVEASRVPRTKKTKT